MPGEIGTKDTDSQEIVFAGANDLVRATIRPSLRSGFPTSASTSVSVILCGLKTLNGYSESQDYNLPLGIQGELEQHNPCPINDGGIRSVS